MVSITVLAPIVVLDDDEEDKTGATHGMNALMHCSGRSSA